MTTRTHPLALALVLLAAFTAGQARADAADGAPLTRAQVREQLQQARADGTLPVLDPEGRYVQPASIDRNWRLSRTQVRDDLTAARREGTLDAPDPEGRVMGGPPADPSGLTRAEVRAEAREAVRHGDISAGDEHGRTWRELFPSQYGD